MEQIQTKRTRRTSLEIKQLLKDFNQSGTKAKEFCKIRGISEAGFYKWRSRYAKKSTAKPNAFVMLQTSSAVAYEPALFAQVKDIKIYQPVTALYLKELHA